MTGGSPRPDRIGIRDTSTGQIGRAIVFVRHAGIAGLLDLARRHGARGTAAFMMRNLRHMIAHRCARRFDRCHRVDTAGSIQLEYLDVTGPNRVTGTECVSSSPTTFEWLLSRTEAGPEYTFVDVGAGKGRTLLLASLRGFGRVVGVEFAAEIVAIARRNAETLWHPRRGPANIVVLHADAADFTFPSEPLVVFFYNPFGEQLFSTVLGNLVRSLRANPRPCSLVYVSSTDSIEWAIPAIEKQGLFEKKASGNVPRHWDTVRPQRFGSFGYSPSLAEALP